MSESDHAMNSNSPIPLRLIPKPKPDVNLDHGYKKDASGRFVITRKMKVDAVEHLNAIPTHWPVPDVDTAYVLDMTKVTFPDSSNKVKSLDAYLKLEVCFRHLS